MEMAAITKIKLKIKKILVPLDGSKNSIRGLEEAIYLARQCDAIITGLCVIPFYIPLTGPKFLGPYRKHMKKQATDFMNEAKTLAAKHGIVFRGKIVKGDVMTDDINNFATSRGFDLIVIASRGFGQVKGWFLGSVTNALVHKSTVPVLVVK
ncbi:MAG: universal stress protein [Candidatus Nitrosotalea sp.]|nr:universal stress protein [Candidatus Nitrosotalea sp.]